MQARIKKTLEELIKTRHVVRVIPFDLSNPAEPDAPKVPVASVKPKPTSSKLEAPTATTTGRKRKPPDRQVRLKIYMVSVCKDLG